jgi:DNA excision repair protein ERCC-3
MTPGAPLIVQADHTILLETSHPGFEAARDRLGRFAELVKSPEHVHFYRTTPLSLWNAAAIGEPIDELLAWLVSAARFPVAATVLEELRGWHARFGQLRLVATPSGLLLEADRPDVLARLCGDRRVRELLAGEEPEGARVAVGAAQRGALKQVLTRLGWPVQDLAGYDAGAPLDVLLRAETHLRPYQRAAATAFHAGGHVQGGCGVVVLPCGAGKTVVALAAMELLKTHTLVLTTNTVAVRQWTQELLARTTLRDQDVGEYTGDQKQIRPVTIATYQILTWRKERHADFVHFGLFADHPWGLVVYDEVHLLPAPVFRATAAIQSRRRLGLTATLVREDGKEHEVFALIGPKRFDMQWKELESLGFLAVARCQELRVPMSDAESLRYRAAGARERFRIASESAAKQGVVSELLRRHAQDRVLVIGHYLDQLTVLATVFSIPLITGKTRNDERERLYAAFRSGEITRLCVSKVGNFAIDLPDANVAIQISGTFGSRQEEAQRLGRVLRPKAEGNAAHFYTLVSEGTCEQEFARKRQLFLTEKGYSYEILRTGGGPQRQCV